MAPPARSLLRAACFPSWWLSNCSPVSCLKIGYACRLSFVKQDCIAFFYVQRPLYAGTSYNVCLTAPRHAWPSFRNHFRSSLSGARPSHGQYDTLRERATHPTSCHGAARDREPGGSILLPVAFVLMIRMPVVVEVVPTHSDVPPHGILADRLQADRTGLLFLRSGAELLSHADVQRARCSWACRLTTYTRHGSSSGCTKIIMYAQVSCSCRLHAPG